MDKYEEGLIINCNPEFSNWRCYLFGGTVEESAIVWQPLKGKEPNWFWRWMQFIFFGNRWVKG